MLHHASHRPAPIWPALVRLLAGLVLGGAMALGPAIAQPVQVVDDAGRRITLPGPAQRVISLAPHLTELAFAAGGGARVVGVMRYSDHPPEAARLPLVGDALALNLERIAALRPDLVLAWRSGLNERQRTRLDRLGVPVFDSEIGRVEDIASTLERLGRLLGDADAAHAQAQRLRTRWQVLQQTHAGRAPVRVFYQLWHEPLMTVNRQHLVHQAIDACGGINPFADLPTLTPTISWEAAARANPQLVIATAARDEPAQLQAWQRLAQVEAVRRGRLQVLDGHLLARMAPRFVDAAESLCAAIDATRTDLQAGIQSAPSRRQSQP